jgi:TRAP-type mannitol/chloroaromatic compound transport system permease large subunit
VITAGGTLGILIPPSVMLIVYAAVAGQSIVKLYAAAMLPGFFLTFLYLVYIIGWALHQSEDRAEAAADKYRIAVPEWLQKLERGPASASLEPPRRRRATVDSRRGPRADGKRVGIG